MRHARLKPEGTDTFMHVYNRIAGSEGEFPFQAREKEEFITRLMGLTEYYVIDVISYVVVGNHFHAIVHIPGEPPSNEDTAERYERRYKGRRAIAPDSQKCTDLAMKLRDISYFMADLEQPFSRWFNRTRPVRRRGHLWAGRFKNNVLECGLAVWDCWKYIEMNPVRARMATNPADYRFCSFGRWAGTGKHHAANAVNECLMPVFRGLLHVDALEDLHLALRKEFARTKAVEDKKTHREVETAIAVAAEKERFSTTIDRRVRYWVDGLVIGSDIFVTNTIVKARGELAMKKRKLVQAIDAHSQHEQIFCFKQLRILIE